MQQYQKPIILILVVLSLLVAAAAAAGAASVDSPLGSADTLVVSTGSTVQHVTDVQVAAVESETAANYTRLEILPSYLNFVVEPGEKKEMTVTVRNRDVRTVHVQPKIRLQPYGGPYIAESSWISVSPSSADIPAGESVKFTFTVLVPADTLRGMYSSTVTFTDETYPTPYPQPVPNYIHTLSLMINVASTPVIQISDPSISDQLEAGSEYTYTLDVKNRGKSPLALHAKMGDDGYPNYGPYGPQEPPLTAKDFTINAPLSIPPGQNGTVTVKVSVPQNASGYFNGNLDLGIDDPSIRLEEGRINLNFQVWKQPAGGFTKKFTVREEGPLAVELTSAYPMMNPVSTDGLSRTMVRQESSFSVTLTGPSGKQNLVLTEKVIRGSVNLGSDPYLGNADRPGTYQENGNQYVFTYSSRVSPGQWTLSVMPRNTQSFEYKITLGGREISPAVSLFTVPSFLVANATGR